MIKISRLCKSAVIALLALLGGVAYSATIVKVQNVNPTEETVIIQQNNGVAFNLVYGAQAEFSYEGYVRQLVDLGMLSIISTIADPTSLTGTISLPTNAAKETGGNLATIATNTTGVATAANQTTGNSSLSTVATNTGKIPALGLAATSASAPVVPANVVITSISSTITSGGTSQSLRAANASDRELEIYNNDSTEPLCINPTGGTASVSAAGNICIPALGYYSFTLNNQAMTIIATTTAHKFSAFIRQ